MKRIGRLIFDLIGLALALFAIVMGIIAVSGHIPASVRDTIDTATASWDSKDVLKDVYPAAFWMGVVSLALGTIAALGAVIAIIMIFRSKSHLKLTVMVWVFAWIASGIAGYVVYQIWKIDAHDLVNAGKAVFKSRQIA